MKISSRQQGSTRITLCDGKLVWCAPALRLSSEPDEFRLMSTLGDRTYTVHLSLEEMEKVAAAWRQHTHKEPV